MTVALAWAIIQPGGPVPEGMNVSIAWTMLQQGTKVPPYVAPGSATTITTVDKQLCSFSNK